MDVSKISPMDSGLVNVFVECVNGSKDFYEYSKDTDSFKLKGILDISFPGAYGFVPKTHHVDGEPLDVMVLMSGQTSQGAIVPSRPIGVMRFKGDVPDDVLIAVAASDKSFDKVKDLKDVDLGDVKNFLESFNKLKVEVVFDVVHAKRSVDAAINLYKKEFE